MLSEAKHLYARRARCFASLSMTGCDWAHCQALFFTIEPCLQIEIVVVWEEVDGHGTEFAHFYGLGHQAKQTLFERAVHHGP